MDGVIIVVTGGIAGAILLTMLPVIMAHEPISRCGSFAVVGAFIGAGVSALRWV